MLREIRKAPTNAHFLSGNNVVGVINIIIITTTPSYLSRGHIKGAVYI